MKKVSVIILNWNGAEMLQQFLPSVVSNTQGKDYEIIVADNGSTDNSIEILKSFPTVSVMLLDKNYGFAEGYNKSIKRCHSQYTVLLNSDVEVTPHWLDILTDYMDSHEDVAAVQPKILSYHRKTHFEHAGAAGGFIDKLGYPYCRGRLFDKVEADKHQYDDPIQVFWTSGACMMIRTELYKEVGGLDAEFFAHMEEIDLCWRLNARAYKLMCVPESIVYHVGGGSLSYSSPRKTYLNFRNNLLMIYKNATPVRKTLVLFVRFFLDYLASLRYLFIGQAANSHAVVKARIDFLKQRSMFRAKRKENLSLTTVTEIKVIHPFSIFLKH